MSTLDVVADILREVAPRALKAREIVALAAGRLPTASRTPETVVSRDLAIDVRDQRAASRFLRVDRGAFVLKEALPTAFYNDTDSYAAQWTRNLIAAGEIAAGVVDERSIRDLQPADVASYRQCHFFSGIGVWSRALRDAGWPDAAHVWTGSCPCQPLSSAGQRRGFADERHLWPAWFQLIRACRPAVLLTEQVASKDGRAWLDLVCDDLEGAGYACEAYDLPACGVGAPHRRQRLYVVAYARERGREILGATWLHDRGQPGDDAARRGALDGGSAFAVSDAAEHGRHEGCPNAAGRTRGDEALVDGRGLAVDGRGDDPGAVSDAAGARPCGAEVVGADRGDAPPRGEAIHGGTTGDLEPQRGGHADGPGAVPDAECVVWDAGRQRGSHGRSTIEPDGHGEVDGARRGGAGADGGAAGELGDAGLDGDRQHGGELPGDEAQHEERAAQGDHASFVASAAYRPGDRVRIAGDPTWGGAVAGFWAACVEWIYCRATPGYEDGCFRPAESGTQPLVDWTAQDLGRTRAARLRGFGNAIVLPLATAFVEAVIEALADAARGGAALAADGAPAVAPKKPMGAPRATRRWYEEQLELPVGSEAAVPATESAVAGGGAP